MYRDTPIEMRVYSETPGSKGPDNVCFEVYNLGQSVHPGVGSTGAIHRYRLASDGAKRVFEFSLDRMAMWLTLPTAKALAVIFDGQGYSVYSHSRNWIIQRIFTNNNAPGKSSASGLIFR